MPVIKNRNTEQNREFWDHVESVSREAEKWIVRTEPRDESRLSTARPLEGQPGSGRTGGIPPTGRQR